MNLVPLSTIIERLESGVSANGEDRPASSEESGVLKVSAVTGGRFRPEENKAVNTVEASRLCVSPKSGDILMTRANGSRDLVGCSVYVHNDFPNLYLSDKLWRVVLRDPLRDSAEWLFHILNSDKVRKEVISTASGSSGMRNISKEAFLAIRVNHPTLEEQKVIAGILSTWDRAIVLAEHSIAAKQQRKQAILQQLLTGTVRLPQFGDSLEANAALAHVPAALRRGIYPPSVQPGIPKIIHCPLGWTETTMAELLDVQKRPIELEDEADYQLVVAKRNRGGIEPRERLKGKEIKTQTQFAVRTDDFVISRRQIIHGACGVVPHSLDGAIVSNEYAVCRVNDNLDIAFLKYLSHTLYFQQTCFHASVGVAIEKMIFQLDRWLSFPFVMPPVAEQHAIAEILSALDLELEMFTKRAELLEQQKKGLMQELLTGKVRAKVTPQSEV